MSLVVLYNQGAAAVVAPAEPDRVWGPGKRIRIGGDEPRWPKKPKRRKVELEQPRRKKRIRAHRHELERLEELRELAVQIRTKPAPASVSVSAKQIPPRRPELDLELEEAIAADEFATIGAAIGVRRQQLLLQLFRCLGARLDQLLEIDRQEQLEISRAAWLAELDRAVAEELERQRIDAEEQEEIRRAAAEAAASWPRRIRLIPLPSTARSIAEQIADETLRRREEEELVAAIMAA